MKLFSPYKLGPYQLKNRMVMAPMTRNRAGKGNSPEPVNALYYAQRSGAGLIITEASQVSLQGLGYPDMPGIYCSFTRRINLSPVVSLWSHFPSFPAAGGRHPSCSISHQARR
jgi:2,4-dienoyl-CoA reductase-like NADH-dependent reductase (Old Yellow Enzyme family)